MSSIGFQEVNNQPTVSTSSEISGKKINDIFLNMKNTIEDRRMGFMLAGFLILFYMFS